MKAVSKEEVKSKIELACKYYEKLAESQIKRAKSDEYRDSVKNDLLMASSYNLGRANAMKEVLEMLN